MGFFKLCQFREEPVIAEVVYFRGRLHVVQAVVPFDIPPELRDACTDIAFWSGGTHEGGARVANNS